VKKSVFDNVLDIRGTLNKLIPLMIRPFDKLTAHHERNQPIAVRPELVEGLIQRFLNFLGMVKMPNKNDMCGLGMIAESHPGLSIRGSASDIPMLNQRACWIMFASL
jgi:hypothetical protein